jgi:hypothetical protein
MALKDDLLAWDNALTHGKVVSSAKACLIVDRLSGTQGRLERHDVLYLRRRGGRTLRMPGGGIHRLVRQVRQ